MTDLQLEGHNLTELVQLAQAFEPEAHRGLGRELLEAIIRGEQITLPQRSINKKRLKITSYLDENWEQVGSLVSCPARSREPWACFGCSDVQTASCILDNKERFEDDK